MADRANGAASRRTLTGGSPVDIGPMELVLVLAIVVVLFGAGRVADLGAALGRGVREFRQAVHDNGSDPPPAVQTADAAPRDVNPPPTSPSAGDFVPAEHDRPGAIPDM